MKKLGMLFGALIVLIIAAMLIIPLVVDVDKYRPQILEAANEKLNGHLDLGHLKLSLWGQVRIEIDGLNLTDSEGTSLVSVKNAYFHLPFLSLLSGSPEIDLKMDSPKVNVVKYKNGKLDLMSVVKKTETAAQQTPTQSQGTPAHPEKKSEPVGIPAIVTRARIGFQLLNADVLYRDEGTGLTTAMKDLNVVVKNLSLSHPGEISIWSDFDTHMGQGTKALIVKGPGRIDLQFSPHVANGKFQDVSISGKADFDQLEISMPGTFEKKKGVAANVDLALNGSDQEVKIEKADINFFNAQIKSNGSVSNLDATPTVHYALKSNDIELKSWVELLPMLKEYELGGTANLVAEIGGQTSKISYQAKLKLLGLTAKAPKLKAQPRIDAEINVATDQLQSMFLTMKAPGNELQIRGRVLSFTAPQATFDVTSTGMDLDQLIDFTPPAKGSAAEGKPEAGVPSAGSEKAAPADYDAMLDPLRQNKALQSMTANVNFNLKMLKVQNARMTDMIGKLYFKDLAAGLENFNMKIFGGAIQASLSSQLRPKAPTYKFSTKVAGLDMAEAVKSQMAAFKDTVTGKANFDMSGEGVSFNPEPAKQNLKAKGSMKITNAQFTTIDAGKMITDAVGSALSKISSKVPSLAGKSVVPSKGSQYDLISADFGISNGVFSMPNFVAKAAPNKGIDLKGATTLGLKDMSIKANWQVIDTYDLTKAKEIGNGVLVEKGKPFTVPVGVGCTLKAPCYSYNDAVTYLGKIALNNTVQSQVQGLIPKGLGGGTGGNNPNIGNALKNLFGGH